MPLDQNLAYAGHIIWLVNQYSLFNRERTQSPSAAYYSERAVAKHYKPVWDFLLLCLLTSSGSGSTPVQYCLCDWGMLESCLSLLYKTTQVSSAGIQELVGAVYKEPSGWWEMQSSCGVVRPGVISPSSQALKDNGKIITAYCDLTITVTVKVPHI